jgi:ketosteroid isomerase-like protein
MFAAAFPDGQINIKQVYAAGNAVTIEFVGEGTHTGDFAGVPPSGRKLSIPVCDVLEIRDGKIHSEHEYIDMLSMMQQIGAIPRDWVKYARALLLSCRASDAASAQPSSPPLSSA